MMKISVQYNKCWFLFCVLIALTDAFVIIQRPLRTNLLNNNIPPLCSSIQSSDSQNTDTVIVGGRNMTNLAFCDSTMTDFVDTTTTVHRAEEVNQIVWTNGIIVSSVVFMALYQLLHVDVKAIMAVFEYGLGPHAPEITPTTVAFDLLARLPMDAVKSYEALVPTNPVFYKACTSGVAYAAGDFISQIYQGKDFSNLDLPRSGRSGIAGFIGHGPLCHYWLLFMETNLDFNGAWWATGIKVTADLTVWAIFLNAAYSMIIGMLQFRNPMDVLKDVRATSWPALRSAWRFWPFVHTISFSHAVPLDLKLLWVDCMEVVWVTILSKVANEDLEKQIQDSEIMETVIDSTNVIDSQVTAPIAINTSGEEELKSLRKNNIIFDLPSKVLVACWPLIAMWPVLWAGYQAEVMLGLVKP